MTETRVIDTPPCFGSWERVIDLANPAPIPTPAPEAPDGEALRDLANVAVQADARDVALSNADHEAEIVTAAGVVGDGDPREVTRLEARARRDPAFLRALIARAEQIDTEEMIELSQPNDNTGNPLASRAAQLIEQMRINTGDPGFTAHQTGKAAPEQPTAGERPAHQDTARWAQAQEDDAVAAQFLRRMLSEDDRIDNFLRSGALVSDEQLAQRAEQRREAERAVHRERIADAFDR